MDDLEPLDAGYVADVLSKRPFVTIQGVGNVRDLGSYPIESDPSSITKPNYLFRSAELSSISKDGEAQLQALGIRTVFDMRSDTEIEKYNAPLPSIEGVQVIRAPVFQKEDYSPEMMAKRFKLYASGKTEAFMELYSQILDHGGKSFGTILRHVRDKPSEPCMFHCTAGKDRTGVIAAIILKLAGVPDDLIAMDYALTRVGREPARPMIMARLAKEPIFASNNEAALNMFTCRATTMTAFLSMLEEKYGGVDSYLRNVVSLSQEDIAIIRHNLLAPTSDSHNIMNINGSGQPTLL